MTGGGPAVALGDAIARTPLATALRESVWLYPTVETLHIIGFALLFGSIVVVDLRLLGLRRDVMLAPLMRFVLPVTLLSTLIVVPTGLLLFAAHANDLVGNRAFIVKMLLLFAAAINALMFHAGPYRDEIRDEVRDGVRDELRGEIRDGSHDDSRNDVRADVGPTGAVPRGSTRAFAMVSIVVWVSVLIAGRLIAYV